MSQRRSCSKESLRKFRKGYLSKSEKLYQIILDALISLDQTKSSVQKRIRNNRRFFLKIRKITKRRLPLSIFNCTNIPNPDVPAITVTDPAPNAVLPIGQAVITFQVQNHTIGQEGESHLRFTIDNGATIYAFYNRADCTPDSNCVQEVSSPGDHTHDVHWNSPNSINIAEDISGDHSVTFFLVDAAGNALTNPEALITFDFRIADPVTGTLSLSDPVVDVGSERIVAMAFTPSGGLFVNEQKDPGTTVYFPTGPSGSSVDFCTFNVDDGANEEGLLGLAVDPNFDTNKFVYVYYTAPGNLNFVERVTLGPDNKCIEASRFIVIGNIQGAGNHNGGIIHFGPDGKLYVITGDAANPALSHDPNSLSGKLLRLNSDGTAPSDNPFYTNNGSDDPIDFIYASGIRNSFGFTFHPHTGEIFETENEGQYK